MFVEWDVENVLYLLVDKVVKTVNKKTNQRVPNRRESHWATFKVKVLNELLYTEKLQYAVADQFKISPGNGFKMIEKGSSVRSRDDQQEKSPEVVINTKVFTIIQHSANYLQRNSGKGKSYKL